MAHKLPGGSPCEFSAPTFRSLLRRESKKSRTPGRGAGEGHGNETIRPYKSKLAATLESQQPEKFAGLKHEENAQSLLWAMDLLRSAQRRRLIGI